MIPLEKFLSLFKKESGSFTLFLKKATVKIGENKIPLKEYIQKKKILIDDIKILFENIQKKEEYLTRFYEKSLLYDPKDLEITEPPMPSNQMNNNKNVQYKNIIRNMFFWEILKYTKSGMENHPSFLDVLEDLYNHYIIDYKILTPSAIHYMNENRLGSVFSSYYFRASILNPYLIYSLNQKIFQAKRVFTPTLGWGSYYYGFAESGIEEYVGTDVIPSVCKKLGQFSKKNYPQIKTDIYCSPSENLLNDRGFIEKYKNHFDLIFFSPPYFKLELYAGGKQSTSQYPTYESWLENYWEKTVRLCKEILHKKGKLCYILSSYGKENEWDLIKDMNYITKQFFHLKKKQPMFNKNVHVTDHRDTDEQIMIFSLV
jgi:hypothetical protein